MINPVLLHIYGPLSIHLYGLCIAIGGLLTFYLFCNDKKTKEIISESTMITIFQIGIISGFFGGRIFEILSNPESNKDFLYIFKFWQPGLSILGTVITTTISLAIYLWFKKISFLKVLDRLALYSPLMQSFGRLGCFFAGCCYGLPTTNRLSISYNHPNHLAPLNCSLHPVQLYSSFLLLIIFLLLYFVIQKKVQKPGLLAFYYLLLISMERFFTDFIRWDRTFINGDLSIFNIISVHQFIAIGIFFISLLSIIIISIRKN